MANEVKQNVLSGTEFEQYQLLLQHFEGEEFTQEQAQKLLKDSGKGNPEHVRMLFSSLRKANLLNVKISESDSRMRVYKLENLVEVLQKDLGKDLTKANLHKLLSAAADILRTKVDYTFLISLLMFKYISDVWLDEFKREYEGLIKDGWSEEDAAEEAASDDYHLITLDPDLIWHEITKDPLLVQDRLNKAFQSIAKNRPKLKPLFQNTDFSNFITSPSNAATVATLMDLFDAYNFAPSTFKDEKEAYDALGDAYEWILRNFVPQRAREGEVYTPRKVINLMTRIVKPKSYESMYDPTLGSAGMILSGYEYVKKHEGYDKAKTLFINGQEANAKTAAIAEGNALIHGLQNFTIQVGDTLLNPLFVEGDKLKQFDVVLANPPWNQKGYSDKTLSTSIDANNRFAYGYTTSQSADWSWNQHMKSSLKENGRMAVVLDSGCLFRGGRELKIRKKFVEDGLIEAIILLPEKIFYNTQAPGVILIVRKDIPEERKGKILFINASDEYVQHPQLRRLNDLSEENISRIVDVYENFKGIEGFSRVVDIDEIRTPNDYNLNVTLYVHPKIEVEDVDIPTTWNKIKDCSLMNSRISEEIEEYLTDIGYFKSAKEGE